MTLTTKINLRVQSSLQNALDLVTPGANQLYQYVLDLANGAGINAANVVWSDRRTVNASTTDTLDIATGGGLTDALGTAVAMARMKGLIIRNRGAQNITIGRPASNGVPWLSAAGDNIIVAPGGVSMTFWPTAAGIVVTAATGDLIEVVNGAGSAVDYDIVIFGASS